MATVAKISPEHRALDAPSELKDIPSWCIWRYESAGEGTKPLKVPYWASGGKRHGKQGSAEDRGKLTTFAAAKEAAVRRGMDGVGFAPMAEYGITALDFDNCIDADGNMPSEILQIAGRTYSELSPSGKGVRAFVKGSLGNRKSPSAHNQFGLETFSSSGFVTVTGQVLPVVELVGLEDFIAPVDERTIALCEKRFGPAQHALDPDDPFIGMEPRLGLSVERIEELLGQLDPDAGRDDWIKVGMALHHECEGDDTGFALWDEWSSQGSKYPGSEALQTQWDSFTRRAGPGQRQVTMASVIKMANEGVVNADDLRALAESAKPTAPATGFTPDDFEGKFPIVTVGSLVAYTAADWFIKGVLPKADVAVLYGSSGAGKSFIILDMLCSVLRGAEWRGHRTNKGRVLYIAAEGGRGIRRRLEAYCKANGIDDVDGVGLAVLVVPPNIMAKDDIGELVRSCSAAGGFDLIVIDTFAQVTPGANENAGEDMGLALSNCRVLREVTGAMILLVHHSGKDASKGARGWSGLKAAADAEMEVSKDEETGAREVRLSKLKDGEDGTRWGFRLDQVFLGFDEDGDEISSCVVTPTELVEPVREDKPRRDTVRRGKWERHVLEMVQAEWPDASSEDFYRFVERCAETLPTEEGKRDNRKFLIRRAVASLAKGKDAPMAVENGKVIFCE